MSEGISNTGTDARIGHVLDTAGELECRDSIQVERPQLVAQDQPRLGLTRVADRDGDLARVLGLATRDRTDGRHPRPVERLVRDHERATRPCLFVAGPGVEQARLLALDGDRTAIRDASCDAVLALLEGLLVA